MGWDRLADALGGMAIGTVVAIVLAGVRSLVTERAPCPVHATWWSSRSRFHADVLSVSLAAFARVGDGR